MLLCSGLYVFYFITQENIPLKELLKFQISTLPWSLVTSMAIHNHDAHVRGNASGLLIFLPFFSYSLGIRKGFVLLILFGVGGHLFELIFSIPMNIMFYIYLSVINQQDLTNIPFGLFCIFPPSGAGISGAICGLLVYLSCDLFRIAKRKYRRSS